MSGFYGVYGSNNPGVYESWPLAKCNLVGVSNARCKKFNNRCDALFFSKYGIVPIRPVEEVKVKGKSIPRYKPKTTGMSVFMDSSVGSLDPIFVFTDGACVGNGKKHASAGFGIYFGPDDPRNLSKKLTGPQTNQNAELTAIDKSLKILLNGSGQTSQKTDNQLGSSSDSKSNWNPPVNPNVSITIVTDSRYSIDCITKWAKAWEQNGWKTKNDRPVKNKEVIQSIRSSLSKLQPVKFVHVNSHTDPPDDDKSLDYFLWYGNDQADKLATSSLKN